MIIYRQAMELVVKVAPRLDAKTANVAKAATSSVNLVLLLPLICVLEAGYSATMETTFWLST